MHEEKYVFVVKKNNAYAFISCPQLKLLDMSQFLAPGSFYAGFLKVYNIAEQKGCFPYQWFDHVDKLEKNELPPQDAFYSNLKQYHRTMCVLSTDMDRFKNGDVSRFLGVVQRP